MRVANTSAARNRVMRKDSKTFSPVQRGDVRVGPRLDGYQVDLYVRAVGRSVPRPRTASVTRVRRVNRVYPARTMGPYLRGSPGCETGRPLDHHFGRLADDMGSATDSRVRMTLVPRREMARKALHLLFAAVPISLAVGVARAPIIGALAIMLMIAIALEVARAR